jgi:hypothetical protein
MARIWLALGVVVVGQTGCGPSKVHDAPPPARAMDPRVDGAWDQAEVLERVELADRDALNRRLADWGAAANDGGAPEVLVPLSCVGDGIDRRFWLGVVPAGTPGQAVVIVDQSSIGLPPCPADGWTRLVLGRFTAVDEEGLPTLEVFRSRALAAGERGDTIGIIGRVSRDAEAERQP